jgi:hypothetical protein
MSSLEKMKKEKVHTRKVDIVTYDCDKDSIIVEGTLKDDRLHSYYTILGKKRPPTTLHNMKITLLVDSKSLSIKEVEVDMPEVPEDECPEASKSIHQIKGLNIARGFTMKVKKMLGGTRGCSHLTTLLLMMAPAALQGNFARTAREPFPERMNADHIKAVLGDTCRAWRNDGPLMKEIEETLGKERR